MSIPIGIEESPKGPLPAPQLGPVPLHSSAARVVWAVIMAASLAVGGLVAAPAAQAAEPTIVSLTFDDGNADQLNAAQILNANGLNGHVLHHVRLPTGPTT